MGDREGDVRDAAVEQLVVSTTRLWRVVIASEGTSTSSRASLAMVAPGLARSLDELREAIEIVLLDGSTPIEETGGRTARARGGGGR